MKQLVNKTEQRLDSVKAFGGSGCTNCRSCTCSCTTTRAKNTADVNTRTVAKYKGTYGSA